MSKTKPVRIVIVDDHEFLRNGLRMRLARKAGLEVAGEAGNASEALGIIRETHPDLVVLDLGLPDRNGIEVATEIRATWPGIKIIVLTGDSKDAAAHEAIRAGVDGFVRKEDSADELLRAISVVAGGQSYLSPCATTAVARSFRQPPEPPAATQVTPLAEREREVLQGLAEGLVYKEIAARLGLSVRTVETYRARLVRKTGCSTRADLVRHAIRLGLVKL